MLTPDAESAAETLARLGLLPRVSLRRPHGGRSVDPHVLGGGLQPLDSTSFGTNAVVQLCCSVIFGAFAYSRFATKNIQSCESRRTPSR
jgi:hypothetical protein